MSETVMMVFERTKKNESFDIEVPLDITAEELLNGLNTGLRLGLNLSDPTQSYLISENPIALIKGNTLLKEFHLHDGTVLKMDK